MTTRPYIIKAKHRVDDVMTYPVGIVEASSRAQAERIFGETQFKAEASSASEVLQAMRDGVPVIDAKKG